MAINPNTEFTSGQVFTASQANRFPRGIMAYVQSTTNATVTATEAVTLTAASFMAVPNRYYKITYHESAATTPAGATNYCLSSIRITNVAGTKLMGAQLQNSGASSVANTLVTTWVGTLAQGSTVIVASAAVNTGSVTWYRGSEFPAFLVIEDIGPA